MLVGTFFGSAVPKPTPSKEGFTVTIHAAHDIANTNYVGQQNPYCLINIVRDGKLERKVAKTLVREGGGKNPAWDASHCNTHFLQHNIIDSIELELW
jgi:hypothetical protein